MDGMNIINEPNREEILASKLEENHRIALSLKQFRFPEMNYSDPRLMFSMQEYMLNLQHFVKTYSDNLKKFDKELKTGDLDKIPGGYDKFQECRDVLKTVEGFVDSLKKGYDLALNHLDKPLEDLTDDEMIDVAGNRAVFAMKANKFYSGKTVEEVMNDKGALLLEDEKNNNALLYAREGEYLKREDANNYLVGGSNRFEKRLAGFSREIDLSQNMDAKDYAKELLQIKREELLSLVHDQEKLARKTAEFILIKRACEEPTLNRARLHRMELGTFNKPETKFIENAERNINEIFKVFPEFKGRTLPEGMYNYASRTADSIFEEDEAAYREELLENNNRKAVKGSKSLVSLLNEQDKIDSSTRLAKELREKNMVDRDNFLSRYNELELTDDEFGIAGENKIIEEEGETKGDPGLFNFNDASKDRKEKTDFILDNIKKGIKIEDSLNLVTFYSGNYKEADLLQEPKKNPAPEEEGKPEVLENAGPKPEEKHELTIDEILEKVALNDDSMISDEERKFLKERYNLLDREDPLRMEDAAEKDAFIQASNKAGFMGSRSDSMDTIFRLYLMAEKGLTMEEAASFTADSPNRENYQRDFIKYINDHPVTGEGLDDNQKQTNVNAWMRVFKTANEKIREFRIPDIDYGNLEEVKQKERLIVGFSRMGVNLSQEFGRFMSAAGMDRILASPNGKEEYQKINDGMTSVQMFTTPLHHAYAPMDLVTNGEVKTSKAVKAIREIIVNRALLKAVSSHFKGRTIGDIADSRKPYDLYLLNAMGIAQNLAFADVKKRTAKEWDDNLMNVKGDLIDRYTEIAREQIANGRIIFNDNRYDLMSVSFNTQLSNYQQMLKENPLGPDGAGNYAVMTAQGSKWRNAVGDCFRTGFMNDSQEVVLKLAGKKAYETFLIDGRRAEEIWGEKYKDLSADDKEMMFEAEIVNEIVNGTGNVSVDIYQISDREEIQLANTLPMASNGLTLNKQIEFLRGIDGLRPMLTSVLDKVREAENASVIIDEDLGEMKDALDKCSRQIDHSLINGGSFEKAKTEYVRFKNAAARYFEANAYDLKLKGSTVISMKKLADDLDVLFEKNSKLYDEIGFKKGPFDIDGPDTDRRFSLYKFKNDVAEQMARRGLLVGRKEDFNPGEGDYDHFEVKLQQYNQYRFVTGLDRNELGSRFDDMEFTAEEMRAFARENKDWIERMFIGTDKLMDRETKDAFEKNGIKVSDVFTLNGTPYSEFLNEKYEAVTDPEEKENVLRAEILKDLYQGNYIIKANLYESADDRIRKVPNAETTLSIQHSAMKAMSNHLNAFEAEERFFQIQLDFYKDELIKTQDNFMANVESTAEEGSDEYREMIKTLIETQKILGENLDQTKDLGNARVEELLTNLESKAQRYHDLKTNIFGFGDPWTEKGKRRKTLSQKIADTAKSRLEHYRKMNEKVMPEKSGRKLLGPGGKSLDELSFNQVKNYVKDLGKAGIIEVKPYNAEYENIYARNLLRNFEPKQEELNILPDKPQYQNALQYLSAVLEKQGNNVTLQMANTYLNGFLEKNKELAENTLFQRVINTKGADYAAEHWVVHEQAAETAVMNGLKKVRDQEMLKDQYGKPRTLAEYVAGIDGAKSRKNTGEPDAEQTLRTLASDPSEEGKKKLEECYRRLAKATITQIGLYDKKMGKKIRTLIAIKAETSSDFVHAAKEIFTQSNLFGPSKLGPALKQLDSGKLARDLVSNIEKGGNAMENPNRNITNQELEADNTKATFKSPKPPVLG